MHMRQVLIPVLMVGGVALASPAFAEDMQGQSPQTQDQQSARMQDQSAAPIRSGKPMRHRHAAGGGNPRSTIQTSEMDVAPGGGTYSAADVAAEDPDRLSHPVVGEAKAPSNVAKGSLAQVESQERGMTANLNAQQLNGGPMTAAVPSNE